MCGSRLDGFQVAREPHIFNARASEVNLRAARALISTLHRGASTRAADRTSLIHHAEEGKILNRYHIGALKLPADGHIFPIRRDSRPHHQAISALDCVDDWIEQPHAPVVKKVVSLCRGGRSAQANENEGGE